MSSPQPATPPKTGGHGDHWGCILRQVEEKQLLEIIKSAISHDRSPERVGKELSVYNWGTPSLRVKALMKGSDLVSAYPECQGGPIWPIVVREVVTWANGYEGQVAGECYGAEMRFFDTRFYRYGATYRVGETYNFHMGALAYVLGRAPEAEVEIEPGVLVSLRGARAYMPADLDNTGADIDEFWFHSPLEEPAGTISLEGHNLRVYKVTLALPDHNELTVPLYAAEHSLSGDMQQQQVQPDDDLEGYLWLQGYRSE
ncbi:MAG: hypothetical protein M3014_07555 [Chloroflexota bacterium]|nr:hypothetical protein [Chloroflexota bacterium]